ncbi:MAG: cell cycle transcriptional regulator TrcR [Holosporales bacterium]
MKKTERLRPLMPKATAVWLIDHTSLTFQQIAESCGLHTLEVQALADGQEEGVFLQGQNPVMSGQLTQEEIKRCEQDEKALLNFQDPFSFVLSKQKKERRYMPRAYRQDRPDAIAWIIKHYPDLSDSKICKLLSTTAKTVQAIRQKTHIHTATIKPRHPVLLGLCTEKQLQEVVSTLKRVDFSPLQQDDFF